MGSMDQYEVDITLVDGAISRRSLASPAVTDCMLLATGAAVSANLPQLVKKTKFAVDLIQLPVFHGKLSAELFEKENGIWAVDEQGDLQLLEKRSSLQLSNSNQDIFRYGNTLFFTGMATDHAIDYLLKQSKAHAINLIVKDFTRIFVSPEKLLNFERRGGKIFVLNRSKLIAVCVNPYSPQGYHLDSDVMINALAEVLTVPVFDVKKISA
jgi:hypothetical protein